VGWKDERYVVPADMRQKYSLFVCLPLFSLLLLLLLLLLLYFDRIETWPHGAQYEGEYRKDKRNGTLL
jgi:hypothetical protein